MYSRLLDFLLNLLLEKWFWICLYFLLVPGLFSQVYLKACFTISKIKCTFSISTWYLWTETVLKATLCFQKCIQSCSFCAFTVIVGLSCFLFFSFCESSSWNSCLEKKFNREPVVSSTVDFIKLDAEEHPPVCCHLWIRQLVNGGREENQLSPAALAAWLLSSALCSVPLCRCVVRGKVWVGRCLSQAGRWAQPLLSSTWEGWPPSPARAGSGEGLIALACCSWVPLRSWGFEYQTTFL